MDWIRRNWVDLLIALAFLAVISGIIATLLRGGSILPNRSQNNNSTDEITLVDNASSDTSSSSTVTLPPSTTTSANTTSSLSFTQPTTTATTTGNTGSSNSTSSSVTTGIPLIPSSTSNTEVTSTTTISPASIVVDPATTPIASTSSQPTSITGTTAVNTVRSSSTTQGTTSTSTVRNTDSAALISSAAAVPTSRVGTGISVGAFSNANNANRLVNRLQTQGFTAYSQPSGNFNIVYLGPYASSAQASQVANQVKAAGLVPDTQLVSNASASSVATGSATTGSAASTLSTSGTVSSATAAPQNNTAILSPIPSTTVSGPAPVSSGRYLQVGAYADAVSSLPQRRRLEALGYIVFDRIEGGYVKLIIGPYRSDELVNAQSRLRSQGVDSFPTR